MSLNGGYVPTGINGALNDDEREQKRRKVSPTPGPSPFKQPQLPNKAQHEEHTDINDLGDLMTSSGVDLKGEEDILASSFQRRRENQARAQQAHHPQYPSHSHSAFSQTQGQPTNFDLLSQNQRFPSIGQHHGTINQTAQSQRSLEEDLEEKYKLEARRLAESQQAQLNSPFLLANSMRYRMEKIATENAIKIPMTGLFDKITPRPDPSTVSGTSIAAADGSTAIVTATAKPPSILNKNAPLDPILSLLSLAGRERVRGLVEDAYALARGRQTTSDGQVPPEWADLAQAPEANDDPDRSLNMKLNGLTAADRRAEEMRIRRRKERKQRRDMEANNANAMSTDAGAAGSTAAGTPTANGETPGTLGTTAPEPPKLSKKEMDRQKKADYANEAMLTRNANAAASMALGGGKKYSWMTGGSKARPAAPSRPASGTPAPGTPTPAGPAAGKADDDQGTRTVGKDGLPVPGLDRRYGSWREDGDQGKGVQLRDWVGVLEMDGKDPKALSWALMRLGKEQLLE